MAFFQISVCLIWLNQRQLDDSLIKEIYFISKEKSRLWGVKQLASRRTEGSTWQLCSSIRFGIQSVVPLPVCHTLRNTECFWKDDRGKGEQHLSVIYEHAFYLMGPWNSPAAQALRGHPEDLLARAWAGCRMKTLQRRPECCKSGGAVTAGTVRGGSSAPRPENAQGMRSSNGEGDQAVDDRKIHHSGTVFLWKLQSLNNSIKRRSLIKIRKTRWFKSLQNIKYEKATGVLGNKLFFILSLVWFLLIYI